ncbi:MAG: S8 family serine peptidase [Flavobacteriales bacterium]|nr:S8 family serine peptidase [Flavobacteriales bacterium]
MKKLLPVFWIFCTFIFSHAQERLLPDNFHPSYFSWPDTLLEGRDMLRNTVIFKIKPEFRALCTDTQINLPSILALAHRLESVSFRKMHPGHKPPITTFNASGQKLVDLSLVYVFEYTVDVPVLRVVNELASSGVVEYAQPWFLDSPLHDLHTMLTPNDTSLHLQWYLYKIRALQAWDSTQGDTTVVIGIVDGGTNFSHPDFMDNVYYNYADPINGIDDDNDGYVDNYRGWDMGDNDNNPQFIGAHNSAHGTSMCSDAAASTNNVAAMAGVGFRCKYMPVKMVSTSAGWIAGYPGIVYAADHGAHIISCSWGSTLPGPYGQDVIRYAAVNRNCQVIAAAGNSNNTVPFYPASYEYVIAVGGTKQDDTKSSNSSYYDFVDVAAPGQAIFNVYANGYGTGNGTSDACAITSGASALIMSYFDTLQPLQIGARLQQTAYLIDTIPGNALYVGKLGYGRIDLFRAISEPIRPFVHMTQRNYTDGNDDIFLISDTVTLSGSFINYLSTSTSSLYAQITSLSPYAVVIDSIVSIGVLGELQTASPADFFRFRVSPSCPPNTFITFRIDYKDGVYLNKQYISVFLNPSFYNTINHGLVTTITSTGRIGFNSNNSTQGVGYRMGENGPNQLLQLYFNPMGFWAGHQGRVSNQTLTNPLGTCCPFNNDNHWVAEQNIQRVQNTLLADVELESIYNDNGAGVNAIQLRINQLTRYWQGNAQDSAIIFLDYLIENTDLIGKKNVFAGIYSDFDVLDTIYKFTPNKAQFDTLRQLGMVYNPIGNTWCGIQLLSNYPVAYYANNSDGSNGSQNIFNGFSQAEKFTMMSGGIARPISDLTDVSQFIGGKIDTLAPGSCAILSMALLIASSQSELLSLADYTRTRYQQIYNVWLGTTDANWHNAANWSQGAVPDLQDYVVIPSVTPPAYTPVISSADAYAKNLDILCGGKVQVISGRKIHIGF